MRTLSVIGVEDGAILAADENGERFRIPVDESVRGRLASSVLPPGKRLSPREIQAQVRAGASVEEVAARMGAPLAHVERFVRPVLAERSFVLESAMRVTVQPDAQPEQASSFGAVMAERLAALDATDISWTSLREAGGDWIVCASFRADEVDHRARWTFDPKRLVLTPANVEASTLSQQGTPEALSPRLRVLEPTKPVMEDSGAAAETDPDRSRFDSAAFELPDLEAGAPQQGPVEASVLLDALARKRVERRTAATGSAPAGTAAAADEHDLDADGTVGATVPLGTVKRGRFPEPAAEPESWEQTESADEGPSDPDDVPALRRPRDLADQPEQQRRQEPQRRPEQQPRQDAEQRPQPQQPVQSRPRSPQPPQSRGSQPRHVEPAQAQTRPVPVAPPAQRARRGRTSLPSWDEIVFGKADD